MKTKEKEMILYSLNYVKNNINEQSQNVQCRNWIKTAIQTLNKSDISSKNFLTGKLEEIDGYFSGSYSKLTSNDVFENIKMIESLIED